MKHRLPIPHVADVAAEDRLHAWVYEKGWRIIEVTFETGRFRPGPLILELKIEPVWAPVPVQLRVASGATLVYDDAEKSMGVTLEPEPQDAIPPQPEDRR